MAGVNAICARAGGRPSAVDVFLDGTTVATNAVQGARAFAVVADGCRETDVPATEALRDELRSGRAALQVFDRGPSLDSLRETCVEQTGLPAPRPPVWRTLAHAMRMAAE